MLVGDQSRIEHQQLDFFSAACQNFSGARSQRSQTQQWIHTNSTDPTRSHPGRHDSAWAEGWPPWRADLAVQGCLWVLFGMNLDNPFNLFVDKPNPTHRDTPDTDHQRPPCGRQRKRTHKLSRRAERAAWPKHDPQLTRHCTAPKPSLPSTLVVVEPRLGPVPPCAALNFDSAFPRQWQTRCQTTTMTLLAIPPIQRPTPCSLQQQWPSPGHSPSMRPSRTRHSLPSRLSIRVRLRTLLLLCGAPPFRRRILRF